MPWMIGVFLSLWLGLALAQEDPSVTEGARTREALYAYDEAVVRFNTHIKPFPSWEAFKAEAWSPQGPAPVGRCYTQTGRAGQPVRITGELLPRQGADGWRQTAGHGWRQEQPDGTFIEYRVNGKARLLLRVEGVKPRFFFAYTRRICEFPLPPS